MIAVGRPGAEQSLKLGDWSSCSDQQWCFQVGTPSRAMVGTNAGTFYGRVATLNELGGGAACWVFLYEDAAGWHFVNADALRTWALFLVFTML
jgi:hypothetical protein